MIRHFEYSLFEQQFQVLHAMSLTLKEFLHLCQNIQADVAGSILINGSV
jgi:hypothetical protein